jgi:hypothetical protein
MRIARTATAIKVRRDNRYPPISISGENAFQEACRSPPACFLSVVLFLPLFYHIPGVYSTWRRLTGDTAVARREF